MVAGRCSSSSCGQSCAEEPEALADKDIGIKDTTIATLMLATDKDTSIKGPGTESRTSWTLTPD